MGLSIAVDFIKGRKETEGISRYGSKEVREEALHIWECRKAALVVVGVHCPTPSFVLSTRLTPPPPSRVCVRVRVCLLWSGKEMPNQLPVP